MEDARIEVVHANAVTSPGERDVLTDDVESRHGGDESRSFIQTVSSLHV